MMIFMILFTINFYHKYFQFVNKFDRKQTIKYPWNVFCIKKTKIVRNDRYENVKK